MIQERATALVAALRSDKYQQATGRLRDDIGFCCLGVACAISRIGKWVEDAYFVSTTDDYGHDDSNNVTLPRPVQVWLGAGTTDVEIPTNLQPPMKDDPTSFCGCLVDMNDGGYSFAEIADFIEAHWRAL